MFNFNSFLNNFFNLVVYKEETLPGARRGQTELYFDATLGGEYCVITVDKEKCLRQGGEEQYASTLCHEMGHAAFWLLYPEHRNISLRYQEGIADICAAYALAIKGVKWPKGLLVHFIEKADMPDLEEAAKCINWIMCLDRPYQLKNVAKTFKEKSYETFSEVLAEMLGL